jgi:MFS transporter, DHA1 family, inner membrane transport protein
VHCVHAAIRPAQVGWCRRCARTLGSLVWLPMRSTETINPRRIGPAPVLFMSMFAAQAGFLVLTPILPQLSRDLGVDTATAGQLRLISGIAGGMTALALAPLARRFDLRGLLSIGLSSIAAGSLGSAFAPGFATLAIAQLAVGSGIGTVVSAAVAGAAQWAPPGQRARVLSWTLVGQPAAWVVGMPVAGAVADIDWRLAWIFVPLAAALIALGLVRGVASGSPATALGSGWRHLYRDRAVSGWAIGEMLAFAGWSGTLVYCGALFVDFYGASPATVGLILASGAIAYFPGNFLARRYLVVARKLVIGLELSLAAGVAAFAATRPGLLFSAGLFACLVFLAGGRTLAGSAIGLDAAGKDKLAATSIRAAAIQFGYLVGAASAGVALALGGYAGFGAMLASLFVIAVLVQTGLGDPARPLRALRSGWHRVEPLRGNRPTVGGLARKPTRA